MAKSSADSYTVESGAKVYISSRKKDVCDETARQLSKIGECISLPADLSNVQGCKSLAEALKAREERLHILVNNAGDVPSGSLEALDEDRWRAGWDWPPDPSDSYAGAACSGCKRFWRR